MNFCMEVALHQGYLEPKNQGASCREKNLRAGNVSSLWRALELGSLEISSKFLFLQNPYIYTSKCCY